MTIGSLRSVKTRNALLQAFFVGTLLALVVSGVLIARSNLNANGMTSGFDFLFKSTGWDLSFSLLPTSAYDPYWWFFLNGILNTLFLGSLGLILATVIGAIIGLARTSNNELAQLLGRIYVDIFRNIPLILQVFFWYAVITHLPTPKNAKELSGVFLTNRGIYTPIPDFGGPSIFMAVVLAVIASILPLWVKRTSRLRRPANDRAVLQWFAVCVPLFLAGCILYWGRIPETPFISFPTLQGFNIKGGLRIPSEFTALAIAIAIYGGSYIAEIVRGGFKAVGRGQVEAARSLGLSGWQIFSRVRLPLAMRAMLPILANQYVWLIKATTMGIAVGFSDFFMVVALTINHSGQTFESIGILMAGFLTINLTLAAIFNRINRVIALKGNQLRT